MKEVLLCLMISSDVYSLIYCPLTQFRDTSSLGGTFQSWEIPRCTNHSLKL
jgi:hypothetical protein